MTNEEKEFWRQLAGSIMRKLLTLAGGWLVLGGWITEDQAQGLSRAEVAMYVVGFLFVAAPFAWSWAKIKFNVSAIREARKSTVDTPIAEITSKTLEKKSFISSV